MFDLQSKLMDWFLYHRDLRHEKVKVLKLICLHATFASIKLLD